MNFIKDNPNALTVEMDTVMNSPSGPYIQTFIFPNTSFMIGFLHKEKTCDPMNSSQKPHVENNHNYIFN